MEKHIHLKYDLPYDKLSDLDYIIHETKRFDELNELINSAPKEGIECRINLSHIYSRIGFSVTLDSAVDGKEVKNMLKIIFDKVGVPSRAYGANDLIRPVLLDYNKRLAWALFGSRKVIDL